MNPNDPDFIFVKLELLTSEYLNIHNDFKNKMNGIDARITQVFKLMLIVFSLFLIFDRSKEFKIKDFIKVI